MAAPNMDQFDSYFRRADLDQDGRISGGEAVSFFQGSGLSKQVLAQIWTYADQKRAGFLNRQDFYNALKLVTVAQSKRELTPDIVKAALYGPASSKIPAPQINVPSTPLPQATPLAASPATQIGPRGATASQNLSFRGQMAPNANISQQYFTSPGNQTMGLPQAMPVGFTRPPQGVQSLPNSGISTDWLSGRTSGASSGPASQVSSQGISPSTSSVSAGVPDLSLTVAQPAVKDFKSSAVSGNGSASGSNFGSDLFSSLQPVSKPESSLITYSASSSAVSSAIVPMSTAPQPSTNTSLMQSSFDSLQSAFMKQPGGGQSQQLQTSLSATQPVSPVGSSIVSAGVSVAGNLASNQAQISWPKMTAAGVQKYTKVFMEVDTDRDGKITGDQARNLFLSWRLPREVLKQVWDLSDQDSDSMLSLREFCLALYLMERYREGRPLPAALPNSILFDETLMRMTGLPNASYGNAAWGSAAGSAPVMVPGTGFRQMQGVPGSQPITSAAGIRPPLVANSPQIDRAMQYDEKSRTSILDNSQANQHRDLEHNSLQSDTPTANDPKKVEKVILDSKEKMEFYRSKMQELVLYKSRCDNRLNEIIERASADKREAELLGKKYEEKYKQVAEIVSKLTIEEATFREYQERKAELRQAIINVEQGGSADGILQVRADRIQLDLEELTKALSERCKKHGIEFKSAALIKLPIGWQPGISEDAAVWNEEWDKFEDEGLLFDKETTVDVQNEAASANSESIMFHNEADSLYDGFSPGSFSNGDGKTEKQFGEAEHDSESGYVHSEVDLGRSPSGSPMHQTSPSQDFSDIFKSSEADTDFHRSFDEPGWGTFDATDDADSVWGFNPSKDPSHDQFDSRGFGLSPVRTGSSPDGGTGTYKNSSIFADSVPGTPFTRAGNSPRYSEAGDNSFDNYSSRFDSFSMNNSQFSPPREAFKRFDSVSSSRGEPFSRFDSISSSKGETLARFDSISSSKGEAFGRGFSSFDDADPFGSSGPFKVSGETPRKGSESWNSF